MYIGGLDKFTQKEILIPVGNLSGPIFEAKLVLLKDSIHWYDFALFSLSTATYGLTGIIFPDTVYKSVDVGIKMWASFERILCPSVMAIFFTSFTKKYLRR